MDIARVLIVDDHEVVRLGLTTLLNDVPWIEVVGQAATAEDGLRAVARHQPDVVVMDIRLPGESGIDACQQITQQWPDVKVVMLTSYGDDTLIFRALQAGASGYVLKQIGNQALIQAIDAARQGKASLDPVTTQRVIAQVRKDEVGRQAAAFKDLSDREMGILALVADGKSNIEIAKVLMLSQKTVRNHVSTILSKLGVSNRIEAATYAVRHDIERHLPGQG
jgi:DNA-binding NarL/FixJ family response regulator